jgi:hypothetical protein
VFLHCHDDVDWRPTQGRQYHPPFRNETQTLSVK